MPAADHARVPFPPPLLFLGFFVLALGLHVVAPIPVAGRGVQHYVGTLTVLAGLVLGWGAILGMRRAHTSPDPGLPTAALVTTGPYRITRNPIYLGFTLLILGLSLIAGTWWGAILTPILLVLATRLIVRVEEVYLLARFGERYRDYAARVRRWI